MPRTSKIGFFQFYRLHLQRFLRSASLDEMKRVQECIRKEINKEVKFRRENSNEQKDKMAI